MATYTPGEYAKLAGIPSQSADTITVIPEGLITGDYPAKSTEDMTIAANQTIPAYSPVGLDGSGNVVPAVQGTTQAIGIVMHDFVTAGTPLKGAPIVRSGVFNPDRMAWPASYDTAEKKLEAFRGAPSPTQIIMRPIKTATVTLP